MGRSQGVLPYLRHLDPAMMDAGGQRNGAHSPRPRPRGDLLGRDGAAAQFAKVDDYAAAFKR